MVYEQPLEGVEVDGGEIGAEGNALSQRSSHIQDFTAILSGIVPCSVAELPRQLGIHSRFDLNQFCP